MIPGFDPSVLSKTGSKTDLEPLITSKLSFGGVNLDTGNFSIPEETNFIKKSMKNLDAIDHANPFMHLANAAKEKIFSSRNIRSFAQEAKSFIDKTSMNALRSDGVTPDITNETATATLRKSIILSLPVVPTPGMEASRRCSIMPMKKIMQSSIIENLSTQVIIRNA